MTNKAMQQFFFVQLILCTQYDNQKIKFFMIIYFTVRFPRMAEISDFTQTFFAIRENILLFSRCLEVYFDEKTSVGQLSLFVGNSLVSRAILN